RGGCCATTSRGRSARTWTGRSRSKRPPRRTATWRAGRASARWCWCRKRRRGGPPLRRAASGGVGRARLRVLCGRLFLAAGLRVAVAAAELLDAAGGVDELALARVERVVRRVHLGVVRVAA